jgi:hypothetical protein
VVPVPTIPSIWAFDYFPGTVRVSRVLVVLHRNLSIKCGTAVINEQNGSRRDRAVQRVKTADNSSLIYRHDFSFMCQRALGVLGSGLLVACRLVALMALVQHYISE